MTTFKNSPKCFPFEVTEKIILHIGSDYHALIDPKKEIIKVEPMENHIHCETKGNILVYRYPVKWMNQYVPTQCAMNLAACPRDGKNIQ